MRSPDQVAKLAMHSPKPWRWVNHALMVGPEGHAVTQEENAANEPLIAAAPDLLEVILDLDHFGRLEIDPSQTGLVQTLAKARFVIAQITGEA